MECNHLHHLRIREFKQDRTKDAGASNDLSAERLESVSPGHESCSSDTMTFVIVLTKNRTNCHPLTTDFYLRSDKDPAVG